MESKDKKLARKNPFLSYFYKRIAHNKNCIVAIVGETGSGKTYSALKLGEVLDPRFNIDRVAFKAESFLALLKAEMPKGSAIVFDESGVAWQSRNFMTNVNRGLSYALQTVRFKNHIIIFTVPDLSFLDAQARKLIHLILITDRILVGKKKCRLRPYYISIGYQKGKVYHVSPRMAMDDIFKIKRIELGLPSVKLRHIYEKKKLAYADELYEQTVQDITKGTSSLTDRLTKLTPRERSIYEMNRAGISRGQIASTLGCAKKTVTNARSDIRRKLAIK